MSKDILKLGQYIFHFENVVTNWARIPHNYSIFWSGNQREIDNESYSCSAYVNQGIKGILTGLNFAEIPTNRYQNLFIGSILWSGERKGARIFI